MFKKILLLCVVFLLLCGCGHNVITDIPDQFPELKTAPYIDPQDQDNAYHGILYNGRTYIAYGTQEGTISEEYIEACVGYEGTDTNGRVYTLKGTEDYIGTYYVGGEMMQFMFYRATDTIGKDIFTPDYIHPNGYSLWDNTTDK